LGEKRRKNERSRIKIRDCIRKKNPVQIVRKGGGGKKRGGEGGHYPLGEKRGKGGGIGRAFIRSICQDGREKEENVGVQNGNKRERKKDALPPLGWEKG